MPTPIRKSISFRAHRDTAAELRTQTYLGREHIVVPVVALVEGVLQGMNAVEPELALVEEFGRVPQGWDGRPVVMNHPVINGIPVSANSPSILESYSFGMLFNTKVEDGKLKTEAWLDTARIQELGGEVQTTLERIQNGDIIEVSTGLFTGTEKTDGKFNGREYKAVWRGIVPDHLAFLSEGVKGACSVEDGCGTRVNSTTWQEFSMPTNASKPEKGCGCPEERLAQIIANAVPNSMFDNEIRNALTDELNTASGKSGWISVWGFTTDKVVYETWSENSNRYETYERSYDISADRQVSLGSEVTRVELVTRTIPAPDNKALFNQANQESTTMADNPETETTATKEVVDNSKEVTMKDESKQESPPEVKDNSDKPNEPEIKQPRTMAEYLSEMPGEMQEVFKSGLKLHQDKKNGLITQLKASNRCKFTDEQLKGMNLETLENLAELANVPTYAGTASPKANASADDDTIPEMPALFPVKSAAA